jgi:hypothetical protein
LTTNTGEISMATTPTLDSSLIIHLFECSLGWMILSEQLFVLWFLFPCHSWLQPVECLTV